MISAEERENLLKVIKSWDFKEAKLLIFGVIDDIQKCNSKELDRGQSIYLKLNEDVIDELREKDSASRGADKTFKDALNDVINWYPNIRNKALEASKKIRNIKKSKNKIEYYKDIIRYASIVTTVQVYAISGLIEDDLFNEHPDMKRDEVMNRIVETTKVLHAFYLKFMYQFDKEIEPGDDVNEIIIPIYKDTDKYKNLLYTMNDIGLMSIIPDDILNKCAVLDENGHREENLMKIKYDKKPLIN